MTDVPAKWKPINGTPQSQQVTTNGSRGHVERMWPMPKVASEAAIGVDLSPASLDCDGQTDGADFDNGERASA